jgi:hypothetical protein
MEHRLNGVGDMPQLFAPVLLSGHGGRRLSVDNAQLLAPSAAAPQAPTGSRDLARGANRAAASMTAAICVSVSRNGIVSPPVSRSIVAPSSSVRSSRPPSAAPRAGAAQKGCPPAPPEKGSGCSDTFAVHRCTGTASAPDMVPWRYVHTTPAARRSAWSRCTRHLRLRRTTWPHGRRSSRSLLPRGTTGTIVLSFRCNPSGWMDQMTAFVGRREFIPQLGAGAAGA